MTDITVTRENDYATIDGQEWFAHFAASADKTDHWVEVIERANRLALPSLTTTHALPVQTYRAILEKLQTKNVREMIDLEGHVSIWTGNCDSVLDTEYSIDVVPRMTQWGPKYLCFVQRSPGGYVGMPDMVFELESLDDVHQMISPRISAHCSGPHGDYGLHWETTDGITLEPSDSGNESVPVESPNCPECGQELILSAWAD